ncbi:unnamed protein product [Merluccius merluccius]
MCRVSWPGEGKQHSGSGARRSLSMPYISAVDVKPPPPTPRGARGLLDRANLDPDGGRWSSWPLWGRKGRNRRRRSVGCEGRMQMWGPVMRASWTHGSLPTFSFADRMAQQVTQIA